MSLVSQFLILSFLFFLAIAACIDASAWFDSSPAWVNQNSLGIAIAGAVTCALISLLQPPRALG